jgi:hypothetical protein
VPFYRKLPVVIEARQLENNVAQMRSVAEWAGAEFVPAIDCHIMIPTLEGTMRGSIGDYVIKGVKGEFHPCAPDIFEQTYEEVEGA